MEYDESLDPKHVLCFRANDVVLQSLSREPDPTTSVAVVVSLAQVCSQS